MDAAAIAQRLRLLAKSVPDVFHLRNVITGEQGTRNYYGPEGKAEAQALADHRNRALDHAGGRWAVCLSVDAMKPGWVEADAPAGAAPAPAAVAVDTEDDGVQAVQPATAPADVQPAKRKAAKPAKRTTRK